MRYLTKSRFKEAIECPDKLFYSGRKKEYADSRDENEFLRELAKGGIQVGELAKCYFHNGVEVDTLDSASALEMTQELMKQEDIVIFEAAIAFDNLLIRVDVLEKRGTTITLYEAKSKSFLNEDEIFTKRGRRIIAKWKSYVYDIAFQVLVAKKAFPGYTINGSLFLIDKNKVCTVEGLFQKFLVRKIDNRYKVITNPEIELGQQILTKVDLGDRVDDILKGTEELLGKTVSFEEYVTQLASSYQLQKKLNTPLSSDCKSCQYHATGQDKLNGLKSGFEECWIEKAGFKSSDFDKPSLFEIWNFRKSSEFITAGRYFMSDITRPELDPKTTSTGERILSIAERQWLQIERALDPALALYFDKSGFVNDIKNLKYPLHFVDFETTRNAIPYLKNFRPYAQIAFQFSRHTLDESGNLSHGEWINTERGKYPNFDFVRNLQKQLGDTGSILIYSTYENTVLLDIYDYLSASHESDKEGLLKFIKTITWSKESARGEWSGERAMVDMKDWVMDFYYSPVMKGSNSIKSVVPAIIHDSKYVQNKYPQWVKRDEKGAIINPYQLLPPVFDKIDRLTIEPLLEDDPLADGGAAMCAYNMMQFAEMTSEERTKITRALLNYCELDTLAMVMLFDGLVNLDGSVHA